MPTIPNYNSNIQQQALPNVRLNVEAPLEAFGGGKVATPASTQFLESTMKIADAEKTRFDQVNVQDYDTQLSKASIDIQSQAEKMRGKNAAGVIDFVSEEFKKKKEELDQTLNNDAQKAAGHALANNRYESLYKFANVYTSSQLKDYEAESTKSSVSNARNDAVFNYHDPQEINKSLTRQSIVLKNYAEANGKGEEWIQEQTSAAVSKTQSDILTRMVDNNQDVLASNYFKKVKPQLVGDDLLKAEKLVEAGSLLGESQRRTDSYFQKSLTLNESLQEIDKISDPKIRKATKEETVNRFTTYEKAQQVDSEKRYQSVSDMIEKSQGLAQIPVSSRLGLTPAQNNALDSRIQQLRSGIEPPPNGETFYKYKLLAVNPGTRNQFNNINLRELSGQMTKSELSGLIDIQTKSREKDGSTTDLLDYLDHNEKIKRDTMAKIGIKTAVDGFFSFGSSDDKALVTFNAAIDQAVKQKEEALGRKLVPNEMQEIANRFATEVVTSKKSGPWYELGLGSKTSSVGNLNPDDISIQDIPVDVRNSLSTSLRAKGWATSEENLIRFYIKGLQSGVIKPNATR